MPRSVPEWIGKTDDTMPPPRVRDRVLTANDQRCHYCHRVIRPSEYWQCDHVVALVNGGLNIESNLRPACRNCCYVKTAADVAEKSKVARMRIKHTQPRPKSKFRKPQDLGLVRVGFGRYTRPPPERG